MGEPLAAVRLYVELNRDDGLTGPFNLMTSFPRKIYQGDDYDMPLEALGKMEKIFTVSSHTKVTTILLENEFLLNYYRFGSISSANDYKVCLNQPSCSAFHCN